MNKLTNLLVDIGESMSFDPVESKLDEIGFKLSDGWIVE